jgi:hypothetical protein
MSVCTDSVLYCVQVESKAQQNRYEAINISNNSNNKNNNSNNRFGRMNNSPISRQVQ